MQKEGGYKDMMEETNKYKIDIAVKIKPDDVAQYFKFKKIDFTAIQNRL